MPKNAEINEMIKLLGHSSSVAIPTDKTNSTRVVPTVGYIPWVTEHLDDQAIVSSRKRISWIYHKCLNLLESLDGWISRNEYRFLEEIIDSKAIPTPQLLIKDHKKPKDNGEFPTQLVVPATNFTQGFPKLAYKGIKQCFDNFGIVYDKDTIIQASDLKGKLESLNLRKNDCTIISLDVVCTHPLLLRWYKLQLMFLHRACQTKRNKRLVRVLN